MVINNLLEKLFSAPSIVSVLRVLNERTIGISGRETARLTKLSLRTVQIALSNLVALGIVNGNSGRRENSYLLNRENILFKSIVAPLFESEKDFKKKVFAEIKQHLKTDISSVILFGSVARGEENPSSDLDLCIVYKNGGREKLLRNVSMLRDAIHEKYFITLAPFYISENDFYRSAKKKKPPVNEIIRDGKIIYGKSIKELANGGG